MRSYPMCGNNYRPKSRSVPLSRLKNSTARSDYRLQGAQNLASRSSMTTVQTIQILQFAVAVFVTTNSLGMEVEATLKLRVT